jgi:hypothetical protein
MVDRVREIVEADRQPPPGFVGVRRKIRQKCHVGARIAAVVRLL